jgi:hypothetical protein
MIPLGYFSDEPEGGKLQPVPIFYREDPYSLPRVFGVRWRVRCSSSEESGEAVCTIVCWRSFIHVC